MERLNLIALSALLAVFCSAISAGCTQKPIGEPAQPPVTDKPAKILLVPMLKAWAADASPTSDGFRIAAASHIENSLSVWEVKRDRSSQLTLSYPDVGYHPDSVHWADVDADGRQELLVAVEGIGEIQFWDIGADGKALKLLGAIKPTHPPRDLIAADLDEDGIMDLVVGPYRATEISVFRGKGNLGFEEQLLPTPTTSSHPRIVDWDGDGRLDILWADWLGGSIHFARNTGRLRFQISELRPPGPGTPRQVALADLDSDGHPDLVAALETGGKALVLYNDGQGGISRSEEIPAPVAGYSHVAASGGPDPLVVLTERGRVILARTGQENWQRRQIATNGLPRYPKLLDIDGDDQLDLLLVNSQGDGVELFFGPLWPLAEELNQ